MKRVVLVCIMCLMMLINCSFIVLAGPIFPPDDPFKVAPKVPPQPLVDSSTVEINADAIFME